MRDTQPGNCTPTVLRTTRLAKNTLISDKSFGIDRKMSIFAPY